MSSESSRHLLKINERLKTNLPGNQIYAVLNDLLFEAVKPIIEHTTFFDQAMAELLPLIYLNNRRKYSNHEHAVFSDMLFLFLMTRDNSIKLKTLKACNIEKTILFSLLDLFSVRTVNYIPTYNKLLDMDDPVKRSALWVELERIEKSVGAVKSGTLYYVIQTSEHYHKLTQEFKSMVVEKYIRLAYNESVRVIANTKLQIDPDDLFKNLLLSVSKAIDKYDPEKGALTSYVKWWFLDGANQSSASHEYGNAFSMPGSQRKKMLEADQGPQNISVSLDDCEDMLDPGALDIDQKIILDQEDIMLRRMLRHADQSGMAILALNIQYPLDDSEIGLLQATMTTVA